MAKYGALTAAIAGVADASGQIVYTDIADVTIDVTSGLYSVDLNADAVIDFGLAVISSFSSSGFVAKMGAYGASAVNSNAMVGLDSYYNYPFKLSNGYTISNANAIIPSAIGTLNYVGCNYANSQWCGGEGYAGLHFKISGQTHYGWLRMEVAANASTITIKDYAYNTTANEAIDAGQTVLGVTSQALNQIQITALNKTIALQHLPESVSYKLYALTGQVVLQGETANNTHVIEAKNQANGVYILELSSNGKTITKKVIL